MHEEAIQASPVQHCSQVYEMTKDGFMFLVMSFTGKKAAAIKESYINAFNTIEQEPLRQQQKKPKVPEQLRLELTRNVTVVTNTFGMSRRASGMLCACLRNRFGVKSSQDLNADQLREAIEDFEPLWEHVSH